MTLERQVEMLAIRIEYLQAIVDGSEAQTREAVGYIVGIVARYLHEQRVIDHGSLRRYVSAFEPDANDRDDYLGQVVRLFGATLDYQNQNPGEFSLADAGQS